MKYFSSGDYDLCYNKAALSSSIANAERVISALCKNINNLEYKIVELETNAHDKVGTRVDENYKDYENLLGYSSFTFLLEQVSTELDLLKSEMNQYERTVEQNRERRRKEEERRRSQELSRLSKFRF